MVDENEKLMNHIKRVRSNLDASQPRIFTPDPDWNRREAVKDVLPEGGSLAVSSRRTANSFFGGMMPDGSSLFSGGSGSTMFHAQRPYLPAWECLRHGSPIIMADGTIKPIEDVIIGDQVIDKNGHIQTVEKQWCSGTPDKLIEMIVWGGKKFYSTVDHKWPIWAWSRTCQCGCGEEVTPGRLYVQDHYITPSLPNKDRSPEGVHKMGPESRTTIGNKRIPKGYEPFLKLGSTDVRVKDLVVIPRKFDPIDTKVSEDEARLLGYYISEGNIDNNRYGDTYSATFSFGIHEESTWAKDVTEILNKIDIPYNAGPKSNRNIFAVRFVNNMGNDREKVNKFVEWIYNQGGALARHKRLGSEAVRWPLNLKLELIKGLFRGDGWQTWHNSTKDGYSCHSFLVGYTTISKVLVSQIQLILAQLGYPSKINTILAHEKVSKEKIIQCAECYDLTVSSLYAKELSDIIWGDKSRSREFENKVNHINCMVDDDYVYLPVINIQTVYNDKPVYNLTVSGDHSYLVDNIGTYNSQDREQYPKNRKEANFNWRMFHKYDPVFGTAVDMYSEMLVSDFDIVVKGEDSQSIKRTLEYMTDEVNLIDKIKYMVKEWLVVGEAVVQNFFSDEKGIWTYVGFHNPDDIEVKDAPIIKMEPLISFIPNESLRSMLTDGSPESMELRRKLPKQFVARVISRQRIKLSPVNCSFIARKLHPYDIRGTSLASRLWRIWMVEDASYASTISTYRRAACFVAGTKVLTSEGVKNIENVKIGDKVISGNGKFKKVKAAWEETTEEITTIKVNGSETLECTPNHRFKVWVRPRKCACGCGEDIKSINPGPPRFFNNGHDTNIRRDKKTGRIVGGSGDGKWKTLSDEPIIRILPSYKPVKILNAEDIKVRDYLMIPRKFDEVSIEVNEKSKLMARLLGYYAAEGCRRQRDSKDGKDGISWSFSNKEWNTWAEDLVDIGRKLDIHIIKYAKKPRGKRVGATSVYMNRGKDTWLAEWCFKNVGEYSNKKRLSDEVMCWPLELKIELLKGMYRGDGHKNKSGESVFYNTTSKSLAYQVRIILAQLGIFGSISKSEKSKPNWNDCYAVVSNGTSNRKIRKLLYNEVLKYKGKRNSDSRIWMDDDFVYVPVYEVKTEERNVKVYNLTVEGDHSYISNGLATLNSPLKVIKLGDPSVGWIPDPSQEARLLQLLAQAEMDSNSYLIWNYGINFEAWGASERAVNIKGDHDTIEKVKLLALGLSKSFMTGEVTYACQVYNEPILMEDGTYKNLGDVEIGEKVRDIYGNNKKVIDVLKYPTPDEMVRIKVYGGRELTLTDNHELPVFTRPHECLCGCGDDLGSEKITSQGMRIWKSFTAQHHKHDGKSGRGRKWIEYSNNERVVARFPEEHNPYQRLNAIDVRVGDWLAISRRFEKSNVPVTEENLNKARLLGYYVAEGSISETNTINRNIYTRFSFGRIDDEKETQYTEDVGRILMGLGCDPVTKTNHNASKNACYTVRVPAASKDVSEWLYEHGHRYSNHKKLSPEVMGWDLELKKQLIVGMYRGDGYLFVKDQKSDNMDRTRLDVRYTTTSETIMRQLELILAQLGYACLITEVQDRVDKDGHFHNKMWFVNVDGKQAYSLAKLIWGDVPSVWNKYDFSNFHKEEHYGENFDVIIDDDYLYLPVKSVEVVEMDKEKYPHVYSLTVEDTHSYTTRNIASFNSAKSGLQVFLRRLLSLRQYLESTWIYPKFFRPISEINNWKRAKPSEVQHHYRIKRTAQELAEEDLIIMPQLVWRNKLDPKLDTDLLSAYQQLEKSFGFKICKATAGAAVGIDWKDELESSLKEFKEEKDIKEKVLGKNYEEEYSELSSKSSPGARPPGGPGAGAKPPSATKKPSDKPKDNTPPGGAEKDVSMEEDIESPGESGPPAGIE